MMLSLSHSSFSIESMQLELVKLGAIPIFFSCLKSFIQKDNEMAEIVLEALSGLAVNGTFIQIILLILRLYLYEAG